MEEIKIKLKKSYNNVIRFGKGKKNLVIICGLNLCGFEGQGTLIENIFSLFSDEYTVYFFDRKKVIEENSSVFDVADDTYNTIKELGVDKFCLWGISHGGMMAQALAALHPDMVSKLVLSSTACKCDDCSMDILKSWESFAAKNDVVSLNRSFFKFVYSEEYFNKYKEAFVSLEKQGSFDDCKRLSVLCHSAMSFDGTELLNKITCPTLLIHSKADKIFPYSSALKLAESLPDCRVYLYEAFGHAVYDEAEDYRSRVFDFLNE